MKIILEFIQGETDITIWDRNPLMKLFRRYDTLNYLYYLERNGKIKKVEKKGLILWEKDKSGGP
ncbi:MAG: hypothetical protein ACW98D_00095 [Promethearchaeota archaeon]|jgi:hypothetical protein